MSVVRTDLHVSLRIRHCVCCGYAGVELQGDPAAHSYQCPSCAADLYARPPRSYYEMEGFADADASVDIPACQSRSNPAPDTPRFMCLAETCLLAAITLLVITFMSARLVGLV